MCSKEQAILFGPFIGSTFWEFFRFAPYAIYLKKLNPDVKLIVLTRSSRFDFYGKYADILISEKIKDQPQNQNCFKSSDVSINNYNKLKHSFHKKYKDRFDIIDHFCPNIKHFSYKLKWQFPRNLMTYDFKPRIKNEEILNNYNDSTCTTLVDFSWVKDNKFKQSLFNDLEDIDYIDYENLLKCIPYNVNNDKYSHYGCLIRLIKRMNLIIGNIDNSNLTKLSLLLKVPIITVNENLSKDSISLLNPFKTSIRFYKKETDENFI